MKQIIQLLDQLHEIEKLDLGMFKDAKMKNEVIRQFGQSVFDAARETHSADDDGLLYSDFGDFIKNN